jgi:hypothetical protein
MEVFVLVPNGSDRVDENDPAVVISVILITKVIGFYFLQ